MIFGCPDGVEAASNLVSMYWTILGCAPWILDGEKLQCWVVIICSDWCCLRGV